MFDTTQLIDNFSTRIDAVITDIEQALLAANVPLVGSGLQSARNDILRELQGLRSTIENALGGLDRIDSDAALQDLSDRLNNILPNGVLTITSAFDPSSGNVDVDVTIADTAQIIGLSLGTGSSLPFGVGGFGFNGNLDVQADFNAALNFTIDGSMGAVTLNTGGADEIQLAIAGNVSYSASATLGFLNVDVTDLPLIDPGDPLDPNDDVPLDDLSLTLGLDLGATAAQTRASIDGRATIFANVDTNLGSAFLPAFETDILVELSYTDSDLLSSAAAQSALNIELQNMQLKLSALKAVFERIFSEVSDVVDTFPIGEIVDVLTTRVPIIDDFARSTINSDGSPVRLVDVIRFSAEFFTGNSPLLDFVFAVVEVSTILNAIESIANTPSDGFDIGTLRLTNEALTAIGSGTPFPADAVPSLVSQSDSVFADLTALITALGRFANITGLSAAAPPPGAAQASIVTPDLAGFGFSFPFLESPEAIAQSLAALALNGVGAPAVTLAEFDVPPLAFSEEAGAEARIGPIVVGLFGTLFGEVDFRIGYDTAGFANGLNGADPFLGGFFISPDLPEDTFGEPPNEETKQPVGRIGLEIRADAGLDVVLARATVSGGLLGEIFVFLGGTGPGDNVARLDELAGCFFNDIAGRLSAGLSATLKIGFGIFSISKTFRLAEIVLAQFDIDPCNPPVSEIDQQIEYTGALATEFPGTGQLLLNVGARAGQRTLPPEVDAERDAQGNRTGLAETEAFLIGRAPSDADNPAGPNELAVFAFGLFERFGGTDPITLIEGDAGSGDDVLGLQADLDIAARLSGGDGQDVLAGGALGDTLFGGQGDDLLEGRGGDDTLFGDQGADLLIGGIGADSIDGGADFDQIDYANSAVGVHLAPTASDPNVIAGRYGDAEGDRIRNVEHLIGSMLDDRLTGSLTQSNILEGNDGNDILVGGDLPDLFLGGAGGDVLRGNRAGRPDTPGDAVSYALSADAVSIFLPANIGQGGEASGDTWFGIEDFQLTRAGDLFIGDAAASMIDGFDGDDSLDGGGGGDTIEAGFGDDRVRGYTDGSVLDGGGLRNFRPGMDVLSYERLTAAVDVDLREGTASSNLGDDQIALARVLPRSIAPGDPFLEQDPNGAYVVSSFEAVHGTRFADQLTGDDGANTLLGRAGNDTLNGGNGNDRLIGGAGADSLSGGTGIDTADYSDSAAGVFVSLGGAQGIGGSAQGDTYAGIENLTGSNSLDILVGNEDSNRLDPGRNDGPGAEFIVGRGGVDTGVLDASDSEGFTAFRLDLDDTGNGSFSQVGAGGVLETLVNLNSIENIEVFTSGGNDSIVSSTGGNDIVGTGAGDDTINMGSGIDLVDAGSGNDLVARVGPGSANATGSGFDETFDLDGGAGIDILQLDFSGTTQNTVMLNEAPDGTESTETIRFSNGGSIRSFEIYSLLFGGSGNDVLGQRGDTSGFYDGGAGSDAIVDDFGFDIVNGGESTRIPRALDDFTSPVIEHADTIIVDYRTAASGAMTMDRPSALGDDLRFPFRPANDPGLVKLIGTAGDTLASTQFANFERAWLAGTDRDDVIYGIDVDRASIHGPGDILLGEGGNDIIDGLGGDDSLSGGEGSDSLRGGDGDDRIVATARGGTIIEVDRVVGGTGADQFILADADGLLLENPGDLVIISDFSPVQGDTIVLSGSPDRYVLVPALTAGPSTVHVLSVREPTPSNPDATRPLAYIASREIISPTFPSFTYVPEPVNALSASVESVNSLVAGTALAFLESPVTDDLALSAQLLQAEVISGEQFLQALETSARTDTPQILEALITPGSTVAASAQQVGTIVASDVAPLAARIVGDAVSGFAVASSTTGGQSVYASVAHDGVAAASGTFRDIFGRSEGIVLSTGRVDEIVGVNGADGRTTPGPRPANDIALDFVEVGQLSSSTLYRAELPSLSGGIESLLLQDDRDYVGGSPGDLSAFDLDAIILSDRLIEDTMTFTLDDFNALPTLPGLSYATSDLVFRPGEQRTELESGNDLTQPDLFGAAGSTPNLLTATLDKADWSAGVRSGLGGLSLGEGGGIGFNLTQPVFSTRAAPVYLYLVEGGAPENLDGVLTVSDQAIGTEGDLSTDLGRPGLDGDTTTLTAEFTVDFSGSIGPTPGFAEFSFVDLFEVVIVTEELPERAGQLDPDIVSVQVNGFEGITDANGRTVSLNGLAGSRGGPFDPSLTLNLSDTGPLRDTLRADAFTTAYTVSGPIVDGLNTIKITVADGADALLDTAIFLAPLSGGASLPTFNNVPVARTDVLDVSALPGSVDLINGPGTDTDRDGDLLRVITLREDSAGQAVQPDAGLVALNAGGTVEVDATGLLTFDPGRDFVFLAAGETETVSLTYGISDGNGGTAQSTVLINVSGGSSAPVATDDSVTIDQNSIATGSVLANDGSGPLSSVLLTPNTNGTVALSNGASFTLNTDGSFEFLTNSAFDDLAEGESATDIFTYLLADPSGPLGIATVTVTVTGLNDAPDALDDTAAVNASDTVSGSVLANDSDIDGDLLSARLVGADPLGGVTLSNGARLTLADDGSFTFETNGAYAALPVGDTVSETFVYDAIDRGGLTTQATLSITVTGVDGNRGKQPSNLIEGTRHPDRLSGTDLDDLYVPKSGIVDKLFGSDGHDVFYFGDETSNHRREYDKIFHFNPDEDRIALTTNDYRIKEWSWKTIIEVGPDRDKILLYGRNLDADDIEVTVGETFDLLA